LPFVFRIACQVDSVDRERLEATNLNVEGVDARGKFTKLVGSAVAGAGFEDCLSGLIGDQNSCTLNDPAVNVIYIAVNRWG